LSGLAGDDSVRDFVEQDPVGAMFQLNVVTMTASATEGFTSVLGDIQRTDEALYCQFTMVFDDVEIDGAPAEHFYVYRELIFLPTDDGVVLITTQLPSANRLAEDADLVTRHLNRLRVVD
jgi:hypothetical protein